MIQHIWVSGYYLNDKEKGSRGGRINKTMKETLIKI